MRLFCLVALCPAAHAQICYQFSGAAPGGNPTFTAKVSIASVPPSSAVTSPTTYSAAFTTYQSQNNWSPLDTVSITVGPTTYAFNTFGIATFYTPDKVTTLAIEGGQVPLTPPLVAFLIQLTSPPGPNILPNGLTATLPAVNQFSTLTLSVNGVQPTFAFSGTVTSITSCGSGPSSLPAIQSGGVVSAGAFGGFTAVAPGSWIELYGTNLSSTTRGWTASDFNGNNAPTSLDGVSVTIGGKQAFIDYISPGQVNVLVPSDVAAGSQPLIITTAAGASAPINITVNTVEPGLLAPSNFQIGGIQYAVAIFPDGAYALPSGAIAGVNSRPAKPGDTVTLYGVGFGPVTPAIAAGQLVQQGDMLTGNLQMSLGGVPATLPYAGLAPGYTGLYQFNVTIPNVATGNAALSFSMAGTAGSQALYLPIGN